MKIGVIHPSFDVIGGAEQTTLSLLDTLKNTTHKVTLYTTTKNVRIPSEIKIRHVNRNSFPIGWSLLRILDIKKLFNKAKSEDVLFISSGSLALGNTKKNVMIFCHSTFESEFKIINKKKNGWSKLYHNYVRKQIKKQIKLFKKPSIMLITNSNYTKQKIKELFNKDSEIIFPPVIIDKNEINKEKSGVITIARYSPEKNLDFNIHVMKKLNAQYKIFGNAKFSSQISYYHHLLNISRDKKKIELFCNSERSLIESSINSSKVYFQSSEETFGISVVESIAAGCIPIVPDNSANKETVPISDLRYKTDDLEDASDHVKRALNGDFDKYLIELKEHIKKFSEEEFSKKIIQYIENLNKIIIENR